MDNRLALFGVNRAVWTLAAKMDDGASWHQGVLQGAEKIMTSWHKEEERRSADDVRPNETFMILSLPHIFVGIMCREWHGRCKPGGEYTPA